MSLNIKQLLEKTQARMQPIWDKIQNHDLECGCSMCVRYRELEDGKERPLLARVRITHGIRSSRWCNSCLRKDVLAETENGCGYCNKCLAEKEALAIGA